MRKENWGIILVLLVYVILAAGYSLVTPVFEAPDEIHHYAFIRDLVRDRRLPVQREGDRPSQHHQPPLYYLTGAAATFWIAEPENSPYSVARSNPYWGYAYGEVGHDNKNLYLHGEWDSFPYRGTSLGIHLVRLLSVLMGALSVYAAYRIGLELFPARPILALGGVAFIAFNPMFLFISGAVNNDVLITLVVTLILWLLVRTAKTGIVLRRSVWIGLLCGLALLTKLTALYVLPVVAVVFLVAAWRRREWDLFVQGGAIVAGLTLLIAGWWFARNIILYGELTSIQLTLSTWHARSEGLDWGTALFELPNAETSFWGRFGYGNVPIPNGLYQFFGMVARLGAVGCVALAYRQALRVFATRTSEAHPHKTVRAVILALAGLAWVGIIYSVVTITALDSTGRYLLMGVSALAAIYLLVRDTVLSREADASAARSDGRISERGQTSHQVPSRCSHVILNCHPEPDFGELSQVVEGAVKDLVPARRETLRFAQSDIRPRSASKVECTRSGWPSLGELGVLALTVLAYFAAMFTYMLVSTTAANGRYMFPGLAAVSILIFIGLAYYVGHRWGAVLAGFWTGLMAALAVLILVFYLRPAYMKPPVFPAEAAETVPRNLNIDFTHQIHLLGADVQPARARPGEVVDVTLYWQALQDVDSDYAVTVQVFGGEGERIGQRDSFTGLGNYPTGEWSAGEVIADTYRVTLDPEAQAPVEATVDAGLYDPVSLDRLPAFDAAGQPVGRTSIGHFKLAPRKKPHYEWEQAVGYTLGDQIALHGYDVDEDALEPGGTLTVTLYWQALSEIDGDYTVFIHLLDESGEVRAQQDAPPVGGDYPSSLWEGGETVKDGHDIPLPPDLPPGRYRIALGLYSLETMQRLPALDEQGTRFPDDRIMLWQGTVAGKE